jgi:hypothetical protein
MKLNPQQKKNKHVDATSPNSSDENEDERPVVEHRVLKRM